MKTLLKVGAVLAGLVLILFLIGFLLPREIHVERTAIVKADPLVVYEVLMSPRKFNEWSPWAELDTNAIREYYGPAYGVDAGFSWKSENQDMGNGSYTIKSVEHLKKIDVELDLGDMGKPMTGYILNEVDGETEVTWTMDTDMGFWPPGRYFGLFMDGILGAEYEKGFVNLNEYIAGLPKGRVENIELSTTPSFEMLSIRGEIDPSAVGETLGRNYGAIIKHLTDNGLEIIAPPFAIYHHWPMDGVGNADVEAAIPISAANSGNGDNIKGSTFAGGEVVIAYYYGPYEGSSLAHAKLWEWAAENEKTFDGPPWEIYVTDPGQEPDPQKVLTLVCYRTASGEAL